MIDVLFCNAIGPAFSPVTAEQGLGGSEYEIVQIAQGLAARGHKVAVAQSERTIDENHGGVLYITFAKMPTRVRTLYLERNTPAPPNVVADRVVIRATDVYGPYYDAHRPLIARGAIVVVNGAWHAAGFDPLVPKAQQRIIPPMLDYDTGDAALGPVTKDPGLFVYASAPIKGLEPTLHLWKHLKVKHEKKLRKARLVIVTPGAFDFYSDRMPALTEEDHKKYGIEYRGSPDMKTYRRTIAVAEGLVYCNAMPETFCCAAAFAEKFGTRTHILCPHGFGALQETLIDHSLVTRDPGQYERDFMKAWNSRTPRAAVKVVDRSPHVLLPAWESVLGLDVPAAQTAVPAAPVTPGKSRGALGPREAAILADFKARLLALTSTALDATVSDYWRGRTAALLEQARTLPLENFLSWSMDVHHEDGPIFQPWYDALRAAPDWATRWEGLSRKAPWGNPHPFARDAGTSPVTLQHAYHLMRYERTAKKRFVEDLDVIVEVGGGYGNFARLALADGFQGTYVIVDLPHTREFQRCYLQLCDFRVDDDVTRGICGVDSPEVLLLLERDLPELEKTIREAVFKAPHSDSRGARVGFVATWSLSETPLAFRSKFEGFTFAKYLIASQWPAHQMEPDVSNEDYFTAWAALREPSRIEDVPGHSARYVFGFDTPPSRAGTHVEHYAVPARPARPPHDWAGGGQARRYWAHERVLIGGSIINTTHAQRLKDLGVTHVLSAESEHSDEGLWPDDKRCEAVFVDSGGAPTAETVKSAIAFLEDTFDEKGAVVYAHCQLGGSRGPSYGYLACRVLGMAPGDAMNAIRATRGDWTPHRSYIDAFERVLAEWNGEGEVVRSIESRMAMEDLPRNREPLPSAFGQHDQLLREALQVGGSELGLGMMLRTLVVATRPEHIVEIGRFKGFSTLAIASGLKLLDVGWDEPRGANQRPDVDYANFLAKKTRRFVSIDPSPMAEAEDLLTRAGVRDLVLFDNVKSSEHVIEGPIGMLFIDGDHRRMGLREDVRKFVPWLRMGGYLVMHDYYGWYRGPGGKENGSSTPEVIKELLGGFEQVLIDTGFCSLVVLRKTVEIPPVPEKRPPRADGRPTVGLLMIGKGDEAVTVLPRAYVTSKKVGIDVATMVVDPAGGPTGAAGTVEICRTLGIDCYIQTSPEANFVTGDGVIAQARNAAIAIAEQRTDYVLMLDPDDMVEGELPKLDADFFDCLIHDGNLRYPRCQLFKSGAGARYTGIRHEALMMPGGARGAKADKLIYRRRGGGHQDQVAQPVKYLAHAHDILKWLIDHPKDSRATFYAAQSFKDAGEPAKAIHYYEARIALGAQDEESFYAAYQIARLVEARGDDPVAAYTRAHEMRPWRAEPLYFAARWLRHESRKRYALAFMYASRAAAMNYPQNDCFFVESNLYAWEAAAEAGVCAYWAGVKEAARAYGERALKGCPPGDKDWLNKLITDSR